MSGTADAAGGDTAEAEGAAVVTPAGGATPVTKAWSQHTHDLLPSKLGLVAMGALALVAVGQLAEDLIDSPPLQMLSSPIYIPRWTIIAVVLYELVISFGLDRTVRGSLVRLRRVVQIDPATFRAYADGMTRPGARANLILLGISTVVVLLLFIATDGELPLLDPMPPHASLHLPAPPASLVVVAAYVVLGWAGLRILYMTIRIAQAVGGLSREPLAFNVFDSAGLLPFGNIALVLSLVPAGVVVILLIGLGPPSGIGWLVLLLASATSVLALLLPLRGAHAQMSRAKTAVLGDLNGQIQNVYRRLGETGAEDLPATGLNEAVNTLVQLRKTAQEMRTWPFQDNVAFARAIAIASAPVIYAVVADILIRQLNPAVTP